MVTRKWSLRVLSCLSAGLLALLGACGDGTQGPAGAPGRNGTDGTNGLNGKDGTNGTNGTDGAPGGNGTDGTPGTNGTPGTDGKNGGNVKVTDFHGHDALAAAALSNSGKYLATAMITAAKADATGVVTVDFTVADPDGQPVIGIPTITAAIAKLNPPVAGEAFTTWTPYIYRTQTVSGSAMGDWPNPDGTMAEQGYRENNGALVDNGDGSYTYTFATNLMNVMTPVTNKPVTFDQNKKHRVAIMMGGSAGPTADATFDFVPDGSVAKETRDIIQTSTCKQCHGPDFDAHGGDRLSVEGCVTCHAPGSTDPHGGESLDFKTMIHKIHAGGELASIPGPDGIVWNDPATPVDESADNGEYAIWGFQNTKQSWWKVGFPAVPSNCMKCHQGGGVDVDNWKTKPSREACGSCHDNVNFVTGTNHLGGPQMTDNNCSTCHAASGNIGALFPVPASHDWIARWQQDDARNIPEFIGTVTVSAPANGMYFVAGESPVVTIVLKDPVTNLPIDHTTVVADPAAEGCVAAGCPPADGLFANSSFFVFGPRSDHNPVLTTKARVKITSATTGPFDISAAGASLTLKLDGGKDIYSAANGGQVLASTVTVPVSAGSFASTAAATPAEIVTWLNANATFNKRAIAYLEPGGQVSIRSRNLGDVYSLQLSAGAVTTAVFANDTTVKLIGGFTASNPLAKQANPANNDPKVQWFTDKITYTLDPVDDLRPGTYVASIEMTDRGRKSATDYKTPTTAKVMFQVGTAVEEPMVAGNCNSCHQGPDGKGMILDLSRHYKVLADNATDQCGSCHDYQPQNPTGATFSGAGPLSKRVHAVHFGSDLNYPLVTVGYSNGDPVPGRNWDISLPQDARNCEACHSNKTSGTWKTKANRLACWGCHDSDAARAHFKQQTFDPTPADAFSGDEEESCQVCH